MKVTISDFIDGWADKKEKFGAIAHNGTMPTEATWTEGATALDDKAQHDALSSRRWTTIVWDDPVNLMSYVTYVFTSYFGYSKDVAERLMFQVHMDGKAIVNSGTREAMERDVQAMHSYGLWATVGQEE